MRNDTIYTVHLLVLTDMTTGAEENLGAFIDAEAAALAMQKLARTGAHVHVEAVAMATPSDAGLRQAGEKIYRNDQDYDRAMIADIAAARAARLGTPAEAAAAPRVPKPRVSAAEVARLSRLAVARAVRAAKREASR